MVNDLKNYDYIEQTSFTGLIPEVAKKVGETGAAANNENLVPMFGTEAKGCDPLIVPDFAGLMEQINDGEGE